MLASKKKEIFTILFFGILIWSIAGTRNTILYAIGLGMGVAFVKGKVGFTSGWRRLVLFGDIGNFHRQLLFLGLSAIIFIPFLNAFDTLHKALAPLAWSGMLGAFLFGIGMQLADGCGSGTLYKTASGSNVSQVAIVFFILGNFLGTIHLQEWLSLGAIPSIDLAIEFEWYGAVLIQFFLLALLYVLSKLWAKTRPVNLQVKHKQDFLIPALLALLFLAFLNLVFAGQMWGIVYSFGLWVAKTALFFGFNLESIPYWNQPTTIRSLEQSIFFDITTLTNFGLILGAWFFTPKTKSNSTTKNTVRWRSLAPILGGFLLGYGSRLGFGCNIGAFFSGIASGGLHGWTWFIFAFLGSLIGIQLRKKFGYYD